MSPLVQLPWFICEANPGDKDDIPFTGPPLLPYADMQVPRVCLVVCAAIQSLLLYCVVIRIGTLACKLFLTVWFLSESPVVGGLPSLSSRGLRRPLAPQGLSSIGGTLPFP
eukprot:Hpha_TRINITY_DN10897_c0_g1::TRINITY_DN10897_c0_g1_i1::g.23212::m.23212